MASCAFLFILNEYSFLFLQLSNSCTTVHGTTNIRFEFEFDKICLIDVKLDRNTFVSNMTISLLFENDFLFVLIRFVKLLESFESAFFDALLRTLSTF